VRPSRTRGPGGGAAGGERPAQHGNRGGREPRSGQRSSLARKEKSRHGEGGFVKGNARQWELKSAAQLRGAHGGTHSRRPGGTLGVSPAGREPIKRLRLLFDRDPKAGGTTERSLRRGRKELY